MSVLLATLVVLADVESDIAEIRAAAASDWDAAAVVYNSLDVNYSDELTKQIDGVDEEPYRRECSLSYRADESLALFASFSQSTGFGGRVVANPEYFFDLYWQSPSFDPPNQALSALKAAEKRPLPAGGIPFVPRLGSAVIDCRSPLLIVNIPIRELVNGREGYTPVSVDSLGDGRRRVTWRCDAPQVQRDVEGGLYIVDLDPALGWLGVRSERQTPDGIVVSTEASDFREAAAWNEQLGGRKVFVPYSVKSVVSFPNGAGTETSQIKVEVANPSTRPVEEFRLSFYGISERVLDPPARRNPVWWLLAIVALIGGLIAYLWRANG